MNSGNKYVSATEVFVSYKKFVTDKDLCGQKVLLTSSVLRT